MLPPLWGLEDQDKLNYSLLVRILDAGTKSGNLTAAPRVSSAKSWQKHNFDTIVNT